MRRDIVIGGTNGRSQGPPPPPISQPPPLQRQHSTNDRNSGGDGKCENTSLVTRESLVCQIIFENDLMKHKNMFNSILLHCLLSVLKHGRFSF